MSKCRTLILTASDSCFNATRYDISGPRVVDLLKTFFDVHERQLDTVHEILPDDTHLLTERLQSASSGGGFNLIITVGGTGFGVRDVTPEATRAVIDREAPNLSTLMLIKGLRHTDLAALSRGVCGIRNQTLIVNMPGSLKAVQDCFESISPVLLHALDLIRDDSALIKKTHSKKACLKKSAPVHCKCGLHDELSMSSVTSAFTILTETANFASRRAENVLFRDAVGRFSAQKVSSTKDIPARATSMMDGYALIAHMTIEDELNVIENIPAGKVPTKDITDEQCSYVSTGSLLPLSATAVVPVEKVESVTANSVKIKSVVIIGDYVRKVGSDLAVDEVILRQNDRISFNHALLCESIGITSVKCYANLKIGVLSTGDELVPLGNQVKDHQVCDINSLMLSYEVERGHLGKPIIFPMVKDDPSEISGALSKMLTKCDILLISGGASVGKKDFVKECLSSLGVKMKFDGLNIKPGKPTAFATIKQSGVKKYIFCLPGNPVSCYVAFHVFVRFFILRLHGKTREPTMPVKLRESIFVKDSRPEYIRVKFTGTNSPEGLPEVVLVTEQQHSSCVLSICGADMLVVLPGKKNGSVEIEKGSTLCGIFLNTSTW